MPANAARVVDRDDESLARKARISRRVAAVAGAAGVALSGDVEAAPITYVPTAGVVAAQGIPGFSFAPPTSVTPGSLRPAATFGLTDWDVDGNGQADFAVVNYSPVLPSAFLVSLAPFSSNPNGLVTDSSSFIRNLAEGAGVGPAAANWQTGTLGMTYNQGNEQPNFTSGEVGYFGFRFAFGNLPSQYYYGWASLTIDGLATGQGFTIGEAFYQSNPNTRIDVGAVPAGAPVPELPGSVSPIALLAAGLFHLEARLRRKRRETEQV